MSNIDPCSAGEAAGDLPDYLRGGDMHRMFSLAIACDQDNQTIEVPAKSDLAVQLAITSFFVTHEHHSSILNLLIDHRLGSALALLRPCFEALVTGLWLLRGASHDTLLRFVEGRLTPKVDQMFRDLRKSPDAKEDEYLAETWKRSEGSLHQYTHVSYQLLVRRFPPDMVEEVITPAEIADAIRFSTTTSMLATLELARIAGDFDRCRIATRALDELHAGFAAGG